MSIILLDRIGSVSLNNGIIRINCVANGAKPEDELTGTLLIPANRIGDIMKSLLDATNELDRKVREQAQQANPAAKASAPKLKEPRQAKE